MSATTTTHSQQRVSLAGEIARRVAHLSGPLAAPLAGRQFIPIWALMHHTGRKSGRTFTTPIAIQRTPTGFIIPLPFGKAQWPLNVVAAGGTTMRWKGRDWQLTSPVIVGPEGTAAFHAVERLVMRPFGISRFLQVAAVDPMPKR